MCLYQTGVENRALTRPSRSPIAPWGMNLPNPHLSYQPTYMPRHDTAIAKDDYAARAVSLGDVFSFRVL
jgi:hypothetical protein